MKKLTQEQVNEKIKNKDYDFSNLDLSGANLECLNLQWANFKGANLKLANFKRVNLEGANFEGANLEGANFKGTNLQWANFEWANFKGANLEGASLLVCEGNGREIISKWIGVYKVVAYKNIVAIGCKQHTLEQWLAFSDDEISEMDKHADSLKWWKKHKSAVIELSEKAQKY